MFRIFKNFTGGKALGKRVESSAWLGGTLWLVMMLFLATIGSKIFL